MLIMDLQAGHSVMLHVREFHHYLYIAAPVGFTQTDCQAFKLYLETQVGNYQPVIHSVQVVMRENLYYFNGNNANPYIKITVTDPKYISKVRSKLEGKSPPNYKGMWKGSEDGILTFDSLQYILRFMVDCHVGGFPKKERKKEEKTVSNYL